jgi:proteasome lid subunit RPN8/RPN11
MLVLRERVRVEMVAHALRDLPHEACGLFAADKGSTEVHTFFAMRNAATSREIYQLDPAEMRSVEEGADTDGIEIVGVMHSHTHTTAYPSPTDVSDASTFDPFGGWHYIIVSLKDAVPVLRSYRIIDGEIDEEVVEIRL